MNRHYGRGLALMAVAGAFTVGAVAQKADFAGIWRLDRAKSFFGSEHPAADYQLTKTIAQSGDQVTMTDTAVHREMVGIPLPDSRTTTTLVPDGEEHEAKGVPAYPGLPVPTVEISAEWQGETLLVSERGGGFGGISKTRDRYYLSADGSELIELVEGQSGFGETEQRLVFARQR